MVSFKGSVLCDGGESISTGAQYVTLEKKIKCLSLAGFFCNNTNKIKL
jgi:hypothetical protein